MAVKDTRSTREVAGKDNNFDQFSGQGAKYAPKAAPKARKPAESFSEPQSTPLSAEDDMRSEYYARSNRVQPPSNPRAQCTDHMN